MESEYFIMISNISSLDLAASFARINDATHSLTYINNSVIIEVTLEKAAGVSVLHAWGLSADGQMASSSLFDLTWISGFQGSARIPMKNHAGKLPHSQSFCRRFFLELLLYRWTSWMILLPPVLFLRRREESYRDQEISHLCAKAPMHAPIFTLGSGWVIKFD